MESDQLQSPWCITSAILRSFQPGFAEILRGAEAPSDAAQWLAWAKMAHQAHSAAPGCPGDWRIGDPGLEVWLQDLGDFVTVLKKLHQATNGATMLAILPYCSSCSENSTMDLAGVSLSHQLGQKKAPVLRKSHSPCPDESALLVPAAHCRAALETDICTSPRWFHLEVS